MAAVSRFKRRSYRRLRAFQIPMICKCRLFSERKLVAFETIPKTNIMSPELAQEDISFIFSFNALLMVSFFVDISISGSSLAVEVDGLDDQKHSNQSIIIGTLGPYVPFPSHSFLSYLGPQVYILLLDCRSVAYFSPTLHTVKLPL